MTRSKENFMSDIPKKVTIFEPGPIPTERMVELIKALSGSVNTGANLATLRAAAAATAH